MVKDVPYWCKPAKDQEECKVIQWGRLCRDLDRAQEQRNRLANARVLQPVINQDYDTVLEHIRSIA